MEAIIAASVAALTIYDMAKAVDKGIEITHVRLLEKTGGKSGSLDAPRERLPTALIVLSDRAAAGTRPDACIPVVAEGAPGPSLSPSCATP